MPAKILSTLVGLTWRARVQALETGWVDLGFSVPQMDTTRARHVLGWAPRTDARAALTETLAGALAGASTPSPPLRPRTAGDLLRRLGRSGPVGDRHHT